MKENTAMPLVRCTRCMAPAFKPIYVCRKCGNDHFRDAEASGAGFIYSHTTIRVAPDSFREQAPYDVCVIEFSPELRLTGRIKGLAPGTIRIGDKVIFDSVNQQGYWFRLSDS